MTEEQTDSVGHLSRRNVILGAGAAAGAVAAAAALPGNVSAAPPLAPTTSLATPEALSARIPGLTYIAIDAYQFWPEVAAQRLYQDTTGSQGLANQRIWAGLPLPAGSVIHQLNVGYQNQPIVEIHRRPISQPTPAVAPPPVIQKALMDSPGGAFSSTENLPNPILIEPDSSYTIAFFLTAGSSIYGCSIGYLPPSQTFVPFTGTPRVLDTRLPGPLSGKIGPGEERTVDLGIAGARTAIINLTVTETVAAGFVAAFPAGIPYPGNSSINWSSTNQDTANGVITQVDAAGRITIRGGGNFTHVVIDRIGYMI